METFKNLYLEIKPILYTYVFELKKHKMRFIIFTGIDLAIGILLGLLPIALVPENPLSSTQASYLQQGLSFIDMLTIFGCCFFFAGIICSEFSDKTGFVTFPKINKYKLIIGKYLGNLTLFVGVIGIYYFGLGLIGLYYYGGPITVRYYYSFGLAVLYLVAVSSFVTFFSSFMKSVNITIVATILILFIGFSIVTQFIVLANPDIEPIYSLSYVSGMITRILGLNYPTKIEDRYVEMTFENFTVRSWIVPTIEMGITVLLLYIVICFLAAALIFKRKQL